MELLTEGLGGQNEGDSQVVKRDCLSFDRRGWVGKSTWSVLTTSRLDRSPSRKFNLWRWQPGQFTSSTNRHRLRSDRSSIDDDANEGQRRTLANRRMRRQQVATPLA